MSYLEELLPEFRKGAKIRQKSWEKGAYIEKSYGITLYHNIQVHELSILDSDWEFYQEPEPDWDYIIKNKCLCWFWDEHTPKEIQAKYLGAIGDGFLDTCGFVWDNCRPVRRDEVTFYEDKKDE